MPKGNKKGGGLKSSPVYKMKGSPMQRNFGISPVKNNGNKGVFDTKNQKQTLKEYKSQQKDFLSSKDLTANQDTVRQSNVDYFTKHQFGPGSSTGAGNISTHYINKIKKSQVNKNIDLSSTPGAGSRSSERIQKNRYATSEHNSKKNLNKKIKNLSSDIKAKDSFTSYSSTTPKPKTTKKGEVKQGYKPISFPLGRKI